MKFLTLLAVLSSASASVLPKGRPRKHYNSPIAIVARDFPPVFNNPNWAGAVHSSSGFHYIEGTITVPKVSGGTGSAAAAWVGIDGSECPQAIFQTGVSFHADGTFEAWYEWYPEVSHNWDDFKIKAGDQIKMVIDATSKSSGTASLENLTTGQKVSHTVTKAPAEICGTNAEWIVEGKKKKKNSTPPFSIKKFFDC